MCSPAVRRPRGCCYARARGSRLPVARTRGRSPLGGRWRRRLASMPRRVSTNAPGPRHAGAAVPDIGPRTLRTLSRIRGPERCDAAWSVIGGGWVRLDPPAPRTAAGVARDCRSGPWRAPTAAAGRGCRRRGGRHRGRSSGRRAEHDRADRARCNAVAGTERDRQRTNHLHAAADPDSVANPDPIADCHPDAHRRAAHTDPDGRADARPAATAADVHGSAGRHPGGDRPTLRDDDAGTPAGERDRGSEPDRHRPGPGHSLSRRSERRLAGPAEGGRFSAADLAQLATAARTRLAAVQVDLEEASILRLDIRRHRFADAIDRIAEHVAHGEVQPLDVVVVEGAALAERGEPSLPQDLVAVRVADA